jgi:hypothetical protein
MRGAWTTEDTGHEGGEEDGEEDKEDWGWVVGWSEEGWEGQLETVPGGVSERGSGLLCICLVARSII